MTNICHLNPCKSKVPYPIFKHSVANIQITRKASCPQITKIRGNRLATHGGENSEMIFSFNKKNKKKKNSLTENCVTQEIEENKIVNPQIIVHHGNSSYPKSLNKSSHPKNSNQLHLQQIIKQNTQLAKQLSQQQQKLVKTQKQHEQLQQRYIRLLQVTNQISQSHLHILTQQGQSKPSKQKLKTEPQVEQSQKSKQKIYDTLDLQILNKIEIFE